MNKEVYECGCLMPKNNLNDFIDSLKPPLYVQVAERAAGIAVVFACVYLAYLMLM
jgi:hypothetical protein